MENSSIAELKLSKNPNKTPKNSNNKKPHNNNKPKETNKKNPPNANPTKTTKHKKLSKNGIYHGFIIVRTKQVLKDVWFFSKNQYFMFYILVKWSA